MTPRVIAGLSVMPHTLAFLHGLTFRVRFFLPPARLLSATNHHRLTQRRCDTAGRPSDKDIKHMEGWKMKTIEVEIAPDITKLRRFVHALADFLDDYVDETGDEATGKA